VDAQQRCQTEKNELERLLKDLDAWFPPEHEIAHRFSLQLKSLLADTTIKNYMSFFNVVTIRPTVEESVQKLIQREIEVLQAKFKHYLAALEVISDEASWFPFQRALVDFNRDFNEGANILNWAFTADFHTPDAFKRAQSYLTPLSELLARLEKRLKLLRIIRDTTLFVLVLFRTFLWVELVCIMLCTVAVLVLLFFGDQMGLLWLQRILKVNFWELQKVLVTIISLVSLGIAALRTTLVFEKKRDKLLEEARSQRQKMQQLRLEKAKTQRETVRKKVESLPNLGAGGDDKDH
jgi:hypothetical protein